MGDGIAATAPASGGVGRPTGFTLPGALLLPEERPLGNGYSLLSGRAAFRLVGRSLRAAL
jgi:hypothetical protein